MVFSQAIHNKFNDYVEALNNFKFSTDICVAGK